MRKLAVLTSALLILAACSAVPAEELTPAYPTASNVQNTSGPETLTYQIETHTWEDSVRTEDGTMLAWYRFHLPEMSVLQADGTPLETADTPAEQEALEAAEVFNTRFSSWISQEEFESMTQEAAGELELFRENEMEWYGGLWAGAGSQPLSNGASRQHPGNLLQLCRRTASQPVAYGLVLRSGYRHLFWPGKPGGGTVRISSRRCWRS